MELVRCNPLEKREGNSIDWVAVRRDYETKPMSDRGLAKHYGTTDTTLRKHAKKGKWVKLGDCTPPYPTQCNPQAT